MVEYNVIKEAIADLLMIQRTEDTSKFDVEDLTVKVNDDSSQSIVISDKKLREIVSLTILCFSLHRMSSIT